MTYGDENISDNNSMESLLDSLLKSYSDIESEFQVIDGSDLFQNLTIAGHNFEFPIQRWYNCKEAFSIYLLENILNFLKIDIRKPARILDTYSGIGTTLLSAGCLSGKRRIKLHNRPMHCL